MCGVVDATGCLYKGRRDQPVRSVPGKAPRLFGFPFDVPADRLDTLLCHGKACGDRLNGDVQAFLVLDPAEQYRSTEDDTQVKGSPDEDPLRDLEP